jgi:hypothetical protein
MKFYSSLTNAFQENQDLTQCFLHLYDTFTTQDVEHIITRWGKPAVILNDHMTVKQTLPEDIQGIFLPLFALKASTWWQVSDFDDCALDTDRAFCIMANKKTLTRSLCLRMTEMLGLSDFEYTWSGLGRSTDMSAIIAEMDALGSQCPLTADQKNEILSPIVMPAKVIGQPRLVDDSHMLHKGHRAGWYEGLGSMFMRSGINLINETYVPAAESIFTEKTVFSVLALNFPIWVGGYAQAETWRQFGFDIFDDVIDHGYQFKSTVLERCWYALHLNHRLLRDLDRVKSLRLEAVDRLRHNRDLLLSGTLLEYCRQQIDNLPTEYQAHARECMRLVCQM